MNKVQGDIGVTIGLSEAELNKGVARVAQTLNELAATVEKLGKRIDEAMVHAGTGAQQAAKATRELTHEEKAAADASRKAAEEQKRLAEAQRRAAEEAKKQKQALADLRQGFAQVAAAAAVVTVAIGAAAKAGIDTYKQQITAFSGLESAAERAGESFLAAKEAAEELAEDGLANVMNVSKALQAYLVSGFSLDEARELIQISKDAAAYNRQAGLSIGEAVERMAEGIRMGNSVLSDAAGISKNLSVILHEQGKSEQDLMRVQSDASVRQALLNGLRQEGAIFAGNAAKAAEELAGSEAAASNAAFQTKAAFGEALAPAVQQVMEVITPLLARLADWIEANPELVRTIVLVTGAITGMITAVGTLTAVVLGLKAALPALNAALGPIGWGLMGVAAVAGALAGFAASIESTGRAAAREKTELASLVDEYNSLVRILQDTTTSEDEHREASERLKKVLEDIRDINPDLVEGLRLQKDALDEYNEKLDESIEKMNMWDGAWLGLRQGIAMLTANPHMSKLLVPEYYGSKPEPKPAPEELGGPSTVTALAGRGGNTGGGVGGGGSKMSAALAAAMEDLADLQALERTPENLERQLAKVREILANHGAELEQLGKKRDLERTANIVLPQQIAEAIDQATGQKFRAALEQLNADIELLSLTPEQIRERLESVRDQFASYLEQHPDEALQLKLRIKGASDAEIRAPLERWQEQFRQNERLGIYSGMGGDWLKLRALREGQALALGAGDMDTWADLTGQIRELEAALQQADFEERFERIGKAREQAFADAAAQMAELERQLIDAEASGDAARAAEIKQRMLDLVRPALEQQKADLEALLASITGTDEQAAEQRAQVEAELNRVKQELYDQDVQAHRIATEAKVAVEKQAAQALDDVRKVLRQAQQQDLDSIRERQRAEEERAQRRIRHLQEELQQLERQWAAEDRRNRIDDLKAELAEVMADRRYQKVDPTTGELVWTYDETRARELKKQIDEAELEDERAKERERLQDQIAAAQERLDRMREAHQEELDERQRHWEALLSLDDEQLTALVEQTDLAMGDGEDGWYGVIAKWLSEAVKTAQSKSGSIVSALQSVIETAREAKRALAGIGSGGGSSGNSGGGTDGSVRGFAHGGVADPSNPVFGVFGERVREYLVPQDYLGELAARLARLLPANIALPLVPTLPASLGASVGNISISLGGVHVAVNGAADPQATAAAVQTAVRQGTEQGLLEALIQSGRARLRTV